MGHHHHHPQQQHQQHVQPHPHPIVQHKTPTTVSVNMDRDHHHDAGSSPMYVETSGTPAAATAPAAVAQNQQQYVPMQQFKDLEDECLSLRETNLKMKQQLAESQRRDRLMMRRLAAKEQELLDYVNQVAELKSVQTPGQTALKAAVLDPAVNVLFQKLKQELQATQARLEETQNELAAWKFTPDSNTGKRLMAKCRLLHQENEELGKLTSNGRLAKLESELAIQKGVSDDLKKSHGDLDEVLLELEEDVEGMQNTILLMQRELKAEKERTHSVERENGRMLGVLRDKPEWLAAVQARAEEAAAAAAAAAERLKQELEQQQQRQKLLMKRESEDPAHRRLNGGDAVLTDDPMDAASSTDRVDGSAVAVRTQQQSVGGVVLSVVDENDEGRGGVVGSVVSSSGVGLRTTNSCPAESSAGDAALGGGVDMVHATNGKSVVDNGQSMPAVAMMTRKRTRSSAVVSQVAVSSSSEDVCVSMEVGDGAEGEKSGVGKRNRYSVQVNSAASGGNGDQTPSAPPRTRGQLQQLSELEKRSEGVLRSEMDVEEEEEAATAEEVAKAENGSSGEVVVQDNSNCCDPLRTVVSMKANPGAVLFSGPTENNGDVNEAEENGNKRRAGGGGGGADAAAETGFVQLKLENGSSGGHGAIGELRQENATANQA